MKAPEAQAEASDLIACSQVWDLTLPWAPIYWDIEVLMRYRRAGFTFVSATAQDWPPTFEGTLLSIRRFKEMAQPHQDWLSFGSTVEAIDRGRREGKLVLGFNSQETRVIEEDLSRIATLHVLGIGHMLLAYNVRNLVADGCAEAADAGLSNFGRRVVREMNRVGMIVDCSHTGRRSSLEAIELSERPAIFSHAGAYAICPHIRNIRDEQIRACAERGGVIGVVGVGAFLGDAQACAESLFRHIDHIATLVGPKHVGLGSDYISVFPTDEHAGFWNAVDASQKSWPDPQDAWPDPTGTQMAVEESRCFPPERLIELVALLRIHGYPQEAVRWILGANFRRVYSAGPA